jgi:hypothetical protein
VVGLAFGAVTWGWGILDAGSGDGAADPAAESGVFLQDYLRRAVASERIASSDPDEVAQFLTRELGLPVGPIRDDTLVLLGAEICLLEGRRGAMILYAHEGEEVMHYLVPRASAEARRATPSPRLEQELHDDGMPSVVTWASARVEQALVATLPAADLIRMVRDGGL